MLVKTIEVQMILETKQVATGKISCAPVVFRCSHTKKAHKKVYEKSNKNMNR
jgi:hypothetical protein